LLRPARNEDAFGLAWAIRIRRLLLTLNPKVVFGSSSPAFSGLSDDYLLNDRVRAELPFTAHRKPAAAGPLIGDMEK